MSNSIITKKFGVQTAQDFVQKVQSNSSYYVFAAKHVPYDESDQTIPTPTDSVKTLVTDVYNDMLFGKKVTSTDVIEMAPRYDWTSNTVYAMYDDQDTDLHSQEFFACVNVGSYTNIYKCLYNNGGAASNVEPSGMDTSPFETPEDGYIWKYMCTANSYLMTKFATSEYIPIVANSEVTDSAVEGAIEVIKVEDSGLRYDNYTTGSFGSSSDIGVDGSPYQYGLDANASVVDDFYNGCLIKITSGDASGEYKLITDYYISGGKKVIVLDDIFTGQIQATDTYEIYPNVYVFDTGGRSTSECVARAIISNSGNTVASIDVIDPGAGYRSATAILQASNVVPVSSNAELRPIISPTGGHGYDVYQELIANHVGVSVKFIEEETPFSVDNDYRSIGLIKDILFTNVSIATDVSNTIGSFTVGEEIIQYQPATLAGTVDVYSNTSVAGNGTYFSDTLAVGEGVTITDGASLAYANIASITNNTFMTLSTNATFTGSNCTINLVKNSVSIGVVSSHSSGEVVITNAYPVALSYCPFLLGTTSHCATLIDLNQAEEDRVIINGRSAGDYAKFNQMTKFVGTISTGTFTEDEFVYQGSNTYTRASARLHSVVDANSGANDVMYVTNVQNVFEVEGLTSDGVITGNSSSAQFIISNKYIGDAVPDSGELIYLENMSPISRANNKSETIKLVIEFF